ncbi:MAG: hypothetical protein II640_09835 [Lachnospiraceae bacterium]|nr:hypothetical protein [Lachnospiraceae bacterium]
MRKHILRIAALTVCILSMSFTAFAADLDLASLGDEELKQLYADVRQEMVSRNIPLSTEITLREGKFIVGEDILPGSYTITCMETDGENIGDAYESLGNAVEGLDDEVSGAGGLMSALGGMMGDVAPATVEVLGDYGSVLKSFSMKSGESTTVTLEENTALSVSGGVVSLEAE